MTEPMKTLEQLQQDWGNSTCSKEPEQYIYDYMKNQVLAERERIKSLLSAKFLDRDWSVVEKHRSISYLDLKELIDSL